MADQTDYQATIDKIISAAQENPEFRKKLIENPRGVFEHRLKIKLPENFKIVVHQDTANKINIVLPHASEELSEVELSAVSGGYCWGDAGSGSCNCS